jgi:hypothetical protein
MNLSQFNQDDFSATYSPEDNKLRLYTDVRFNPEEWQEMNDMGFGWAPVQNLLYCYWSVNREDFCMSLAGDIMPEEMTMVERADAKVNRLILLAEKRADQAIGYQRAANDLSNRLSNNQPILLGHHSQRKAEKQAGKLERIVEHAQDKAQAVGYWVWKAQGVVSHANHKNSSRTVHNRIKGLLKDLRTAQRAINEAGHTLDVIELVRGFKPDAKTKYTEMLAGEWKISKLGYLTQLQAGEITEDETLDLVKDVHMNIINNPKRARIISHILNRLGYEQNQLSIVSLYDGELSPAIIQTFLRTHGADKPKATKSDYGYIAKSTVYFPLHIRNGLSMELTCDEWRELMQSLGYEVPAKRAVSTKAKTPILNFRHEAGFLATRGYQEKQYRQVELTKAGYKAIGSDWNSTQVSKCGLFRFRLGYVDTGVPNGWGNGCEWVSVFLTDSKVHDAPEGYLIGELL